MIKLRRVLVHDLLCKAHGILSFGWWHLILVMLQLGRILLRLIGKQVHYSAFAGSTLVDGEACAKFSMSADLDGFEQLGREVLAIIADEIVCWAFLAPDIVEM